MKPLAIGQRFEKVGNGLEDRRERGAASDQPEADGKGRSVVNRRDHLPAEIPPQVVQESA